VNAGRTTHLARVVERMGADVRLCVPARETRLQRVEDAWARDRPQRSVGAATRELRRRRFAPAAPRAPDRAG
jgi:hypothetical protein